MKSFYQKLAFLGVSTGLMASTIMPTWTAAVSKPYSSTNLSKFEAKGINSGDTEKQNPLSKDTLVIKFDKPLTATEHKLAGGTVVKQFSNLHYAVVKVKDKKNLYKVIQKYQKLQKVQSISPSVNYQTMGNADPKAAEQYHLSMLNIAKAQQLAGKNKVTVAIIDTGIDTKHPDLKGLFLPGYNALDPMHQPATDNHGTHVAGIIAANKNNGIGGYGINPNVKILPIDVFERWGASDYSIAEGILHAVKKGAKVINMSLGGPMPSPLIEEAINKANEKGVVVVASAGNSGDDWVNYPAGYEGVISVGAVDSRKKLADYSSYGTSVDLVAPGDEIYSTFYEAEKKSSFQKMSGTSMASPMVAGAAALLLSKYPKLTPSQVEYILEQSASDLGPAGFDEKYANGLLNVVEAMKFNTKKVPTFVKEKWNQEEILNNAQKVESNDKIKIDGQITKPFEQKWIQFKVEEGDSIQAVLEGAEQYDYKMMIHFYGDNKKETMDVNSTGAGKSEGKLVKAPFSGTVAIGVKDVNGSYDSTSKKQSHYSLSVEKTKELPKDDSSVENMVAIDALPFEPKEGYTFIGEKGDNDYFTFKVEEKQAVKITTTGVPAVNPSMSLYQLDQILSPDEETTEEEKTKLLKNTLEGKDEIEPIAYANNGGTSEGDKLAYSAEPGIYILKVSNKPSNYFGLFDFFMGMEISESNISVEQSIIPYGLKIETKVLPEDEDNYPKMEDKESTEETEGNESLQTDALAKQRAALAETEEQESEVPQTEDPNEYVQGILDSARPYSMIGETSAYLQNNMDEDWYIIKPEQTAIFKFTLENKDNEIPMMDIYQLDEEKNEKGEKILNLNNLGDNIDWGSSLISTKKNFYTGFKKGKTYLVNIQSNYFSDSNSISFEPYKLSSKVRLSGVEDQYEDNDSFENVKNLPGASFKGNFAMPYEDLLSIYAGLTGIIEDRNNNRKIDEEEYNYVHIIDKGIWGHIYGSFNAKKGKNYFIMMEPMMNGNVPMSIVPYTFTLASAPTKDEDAGSVVKKNIPSKPLKLKGTKVKTATGYFNAGITKGDSDWYEYNVTKNTKGVIKLSAGQEIDGVISVYKNGKLVLKSDYYSGGDAEITPFNLKKGRYHIKVNDVNGNASMKPYKLSISTNK
ncbi:S8 family peptidase [Rummeliibacillus stabekisii]|uniref:S8 family peptidase n=1 Tax=Rummeliibacillus stabekisii TaxID=241244 RepID=UPI001F177244|nr:S8 family peptidase [Rummeliibacillus stabekisii]